MDVRTEIFIIVRGMIVNIDQWNKVLDAIAKPKTWKGVEYLHDTWKHLELIEKVINTC